MKTIKKILKIKQRFRSEKHNVFTEEINEDRFKFKWWQNRMQSIDSIETYAPGTSKDLVRKKKEIKCNNIIKQYKNV